MVAELHRRLPIFHPQSPESFEVSTCEVRRWGPKDVTAQSSFRFGCGGRQGNFAQFWGVRQGDRLSPCTGWTAHCLNRQFLRLWIGNLSNSIWKSSECLWFPSDGHRFLRFSLVPNVLFLFSSFVSSCLSIFVSTKKASPSSAGVRMPQPQLCKPNLRGRMVAKRRMREHGA